MSDKNGGFKGNGSYHTNFDNDAYKSNDNYVNNDKNLYNERHINHKAAFSYFGMIVLILLVAVLIRRFNGVNAYPTFTGFLEYFTNIDVPSIPFSKDLIGVIKDDWGWFNFFRDFLNSFVSIFDVFIFFCNGLLSVCSYIGTFFKWLFVF